MTTRRLILADDNIRDVGGHYYELASLLLAGAQELGYQGVLATHRSFQDLGALNPSWPVHPVFQTRRLVRWSLGVDGDSRFQRDLAGQAVGGNRLQNLWTRITDQLAAPAKRPAQMLDQWAEDLCRLLAEVQPTSDDSLLINTSDDFSMLALAAAMRRASVPPLRIDVIFHFALYDVDQPDRKQRLRQLGRQVRSAIESLHPHSVHVHATTDALADQLREADCGIPINAIPYPTRRRSPSDANDDFPVKAVLAGFPRAEKGREAIADLLSASYQPLLQTGRYRISMQMPQKRWRSMVPKALVPTYQRAVQGNTDGPLEVITSNLSTDDYHRWLDTADLGLFLYDPKRYVARCSGVLLEMLARGVPVIVPDHCWLAEQVRLAGGHRAVGLIYQNRSEIPDLMQQFVDRRPEMQANAMAYASTLTRRHNGRNSLAEMGLGPSAQTIAA